MPEGGGLPRTDDDELGRANGEPHSWCRWWRGERMSEARRERRTRRRHRSRLARPDSTPRRQIKMSAAIIRMIEPYDLEDLELDQHRILIKACTLAWNMAVVEQFAVAADRRCGTRSLVCA